MKKLFFLFSACFGFYLVTNAQPLSIEINGTASFSNMQYNVSEAGMDFASSLESESQLYINIEYTSIWDKWFNPNTKWKINIQKTDVNWHPDIVIETKRTGNGNRPWYGQGSVNIHDGVTYQAITNTPTYFFRGRNEILNIPVSIKLSGISLVMGAQDFETNILLTVYED